MFTFEPCKGFAVSTSKQLKPLEYCLTQERIQT